MSLVFHSVDDPVVLHVDFGVFSEDLSIGGDFLKVLKVLFFKKEVVSCDDFAFGVVKPLNLPAFLVLDVVDDAALFPLEVAFEVLPLAVADHEILF
jgi:hypothetical protein